MTEKPRVVSACMKRIVRANGRAQQKPLISGLVTATLGEDSACAAAGDVGGRGESFSGHSVAEVRDGHLLIRWDGPAGYCWKLLLRHLNLTPCDHAIYGFRLSRPGCKSPIVTIVVDTGTDYHHWTTTVAGQLLSQTPLEDVKYLDILGIVTDRMPNRRHSSIDSLTMILSKHKKTSLDMQEVNNNQNQLLDSQCLNKKNVSHLPDLIRECEQSRRLPINEFSDFVPVKQKRKMFEKSLMCSSKSVQNLTNYSSHTANIKSSRSMHNLDLIAVPVKDICRYFESRFNANEKNTIKFRSLY